MWKNICVLRQETLIYRKARRHLANHRSVPVLLSTIHCGEILQNPSGRIAAEFIKLFIPVILHGHSDNMLLDYKGVWTGRTGRQSSEHEIIVAEKQAGTQPFHPFASGDERVQTSFLKSAQPGRLLGLSHLLPFCCQWMATIGADSAQCFVPGIPRRKRRTTSPLDLLLWEIPGALKKLQIKTQTKQKPWAAQYSQECWKILITVRYGCVKTKTNKNANQDKQTNQKEKKANFGLSNSWDTGLR